jgi:hypothetical protein
LYAFVRQDGRDAGRDEADDPLPDPAHQDSQHGRRWVGFRRLVEGRSKAPLVTRSLLTTPLHVTPTVR